jgi:DNA-binding response OmpR family regulator
MTCILVVEGEADIRETLVEALRDAGFDVVEANSADAAIQLLGMEGLRLIVTDVNLPGRLDGIDLAFAARETSPGIPVVFISGRPAMLEDAHALGQPAAFLQKPFSFKMLVGDIRRLSDAPR